MPQAQPVSPTASSSTARKYRKYKSHFQFILATRHRLLTRAGGHWDWKSAGVVGSARAGVQRPGSGRVNLSGPMRCQRRGTKSWRRSVIRPVGGQRQRDRECQIARSNWRCGAGRAAARAGGSAAKSIPKPQANVG